MFGETASLCQKIEVYMRYVVYSSFACTLTVVMSENMV